MSAWIAAKNGVGVISVKKFIFLFPIKLLLKQTTSLGLRHSRCHTDCPPDCANDPDNYT
jgi:hypothetical protein